MFLSMFLKTNVWICFFNLIIFYLIQCLELYGIRFSRLSIPLSSKKINFTFFLQQKSDFFEKIVIFQHKILIIFKTTLDIRKNIFALERAKLVRAINCKY